MLQRGYEWNDPRDIVDLFEKKLAGYANSKYAVLTDSCSNALFLCMRLRNVTGEVKIPAQTYVSLPMQILHAGAKPCFEEISWSGIYELGETGIYDSAARFTKNMYVGEGALQCLSFQIKKRLPIGRGGAILTNNFHEYQQLKLMTYDGRDLSLPYSDSQHVQSLGWHCYMTPEDAARGILLMEMLAEENEDTMTFDHYPDLRQWPLLKKLISKD